MRRVRTRSKPPVEHMAKVKLDYLIHISTYIYLSAHVRVVHRSFVHSFVYIVQQQQHQQQYQIAALYSTYK